MKSIFIICLSFLVFFNSFSQKTPFEQSNGKETATYFEAINFYKSLSKSSGKIKILSIGATDAGFPLNLILLSNDKKFDPIQWHKDHKVVLLINNGIHPGEPDGIDASMMLVRDILNGKVKFPDQVVIGVIPIYNIGGSLNRNAFSRVNQNGPNSYGFRGNSQNLDLNRDFTKNDTKNSSSFVQIFHFLEPDILIDNHVSDGADYQHTMTLIATQYDKLGGSIGQFLKNYFEPALYKNMSTKGWDMVPYVNFETSSPDKGMEQFYDQPRYSSGYAALFQTISFMPETHMLKPFSDRVKSTYDLMRAMIDEASKQRISLLAARKQSIDNIKTAGNFPLTWIADSIQHTQITFKGYEQAFKTSEATGLQRMYFDHNKPFTRQVNYYNHFIPAQITPTPKSYLIPQGWWAVLDILKLNGVIMERLPKDTMIEVQCYRISDYKTFPKAYEKHHKNYSVTVSSNIQPIAFRKGDYVIKMDQKNNRYILEMLEPTGDDSFFAWNFFDAILQQKEGYSDYRWEDVASDVIKKDPALKTRLEDKKSKDPAFAKSSSAQLDFIYKNSPYYEPAHLRYPVYRLN